MTKNKTDTEELMKSNHRYVELIAIYIFEQILCRFEGAMGFHCN